MYGENDNIGEEKRENENQIIDNVPVTITEQEKEEKKSEIRQDAQNDNGQHENVSMNQEDARNFYYDAYYEAERTKSAPEEAAKGKRAKREKKPHPGVKRLVKKGIAIVASAAVFGVVAGAAFQGVEYFSSGNGGGQEPVQEGTTITPPTTESPAVQTGINSGALVTDVSDVVENVMPSIVAINSTVAGTTYDWFGRPYQNEQYGSGSGIIIGQNDDEILIVTNNHVVDSATKVEIVFDDDSTAEATIKGTDSSSDLAVVAVKVSELSAETLGHIKIATLGSSGEMKPGELVIAIGNALGYGQSVTVGYVSALEREVTVDGVTRKLLQTDAAINPGNSGGALLNSKGEVIGINSVKYSSEEVEGIGFAIPVDDAIPIINELMNRETLSESEMGYLGINGSDITESYSQAFNMPVGICVTDVGAGSPAEKAGILNGYIIVGINGRTIETKAELQQILSYTRAGAQVTVQVKVLENGEYVEKDIEVTLGSRG